MSALEKAELSAAQIIEEPRPPPLVRAAIGFLVPRFPDSGDTGLLSEIRELEQQGQPVVLIPLLRDSGRAGHEWRWRALDLPLFSAAIARANLASFFRHPLRYTRLLLRLILGTLVRPSALIRTLSLFPKSIYLACVLPPMGVGHVHAHTATRTATAAYIIASMSEVTFSFTVHGPDVFVHRPLLADKLAKTKFVRTVSTFNKAFLRGLYPTLATGRIEVVPLGIDGGGQAILPVPARTTARPPRLLCIAGRAPNEGISYLIDACVRLIRDGVEVDCTIVGEGDWIIPPDLAERFHLPGAVPQHEAAALIRDCDVFVLPGVIAANGQMDGVPTALIEAMAAGRPVVASALSGIAELVEHGVSGLLIDATRPDRLAAALRQLAEDPALRERMGGAGQRRVRADFDARLTSASFIALLDRHRHPSTAAAERVAGLDWDRLGIRAIGVRRIVERSNSTVADVIVTGGASNRNVIVKLHGDSGAARIEYDTLHRLRRGMTQTMAESTSICVYTVPRALMLDEPNAAVITERAPGERLESMLRRRRAAQVVTPLRRAGTWLRLMQEQTRAGEDGRGLLAATVNIALRDLDLAAAADRAVRRHHSAVADRLRELESHVQDRVLPVVGHHGDFSPANVFVSPRRIEVANVDDLCEGLPLGDVASFLLRLEAGFPRHREAAAVFLAGYTDAPIDLPSLQLFRMAKALEILARAPGGVRPSGAARRRLIGVVIGEPW
jgi:glycosyltransferase involved in cell wall biosynthesis